MAALLPTLQTSHIGLNVSNIERSKQFYEEVFGFSVVGESKEKGREFVFLGLGDKLILTLWQQSAGTFSKTTPGLHHLSFQVDSIEQVKEAERRLLTLGTAFAHSGVVPHHEGTESGGLFFEDPDGIRLEINTPSGADENPAPYGSAPTCGFF